MVLRISGSNFHSYNISTHVYQGPLDLLLKLIENAELDITKLALAEVTDQYLQYLDHIQDKTADEVSAFITIAAKLIQIKSEALLPRPIIRGEDEEDPGEELARQLKEYKKFKKIADFLSNQEELGLRSFSRAFAPPTVPIIPDFTDIEINDFYLLAYELLMKEQHPTKLDDVVSLPKFSIREKISLITELIRQHQNISFFELFKNHNSKLEIVVTFLALLELIKQKWVEVKQSTIFGDIMVEPTSDFDTTKGFELEFGE